MANETPRGNARPEAALCLYAKPPIAGKTKSRLARTLGDQAAAAFAEAVLQDVCRTLSQIERTAFSVWHPPDAEPQQFYESIGSSYSFYPQAGDDLGRRMHNTARHMLERFSKIIIVGSDCVSHDKTVIYSALEALDSSDVVLQPADDGGYVLIGLRKNCPELFSNVSWGTEAVLSESISLLQKHNRSFELLPQTFDIDEEEDLQKISPVITPATHPATSQWLSTYRSSR